MMVGSINSPARITKITTTKYIKCFLHYDALAAPPKSVNSGPIPSVNALGSWVMSKLARSRTSFAHAGPVSAAPPSWGRHPQTFTKPEVADTSHAKKKPPVGGSLNSDLLIVDQPKRNTGFDFRRYAMKPTPAKPSIIMAQVEGSGTADASAPTPPVAVAAPGPVVGPLARSDAKYI
jgi:hypothetical protein